jgi:hypothetical protein
MSAPTVAMVATFEMKLPAMIVKATTPKTSSS